MLDTRRMAHVKSGRKRPQCVASAKQAPAGLLSFWQKEEWQGTVINRGGIPECFGELETALRDQHPGMERLS